MKIEELKEVIPYKWRVQGAAKSYGKDVVNCVAYIDSRDVQDLLDKVVGPENWQSDFKEVKGNLFCGIGIVDELNEWVWKWDCGTESNVEKQKGEASDSFKRAAVQWGIGRFLYSLPVIQLPAKPNTWNQKITPYSEKQNKFATDKETINFWCVAMLETLKK